MDDKHKTKAQLIEELNELRQRISALESGEKPEQEPAGDHLGADRLGMAILDCLVDHFSIQGLDMRLEWANSAFCKAHNTTPEEASGHYCYEVVKGLSEPCPQCPLVKSPNSDQRYESEVLKKGATTWLIDAYPLFDEHHQQRGYIKVARDISELQRTKEAKSASVKMFKALFRSLPTAAGITSWPDSRFLDVNQALCTLTGYEREELVGLKACRFGFFGGEAAFRDFGKTLKDTGAYRNDSTIRTKSGEVRTGIWSAERLDLHPEPVIISTFTDITKLKQAQESLRESREMLSNAFRVSPVAAAISRTADGVFVEANDAFFHLIGIKREEVLGHNADELGICQECGKWSQLTEDLVNNGSVKQKEIVISPATGGRVVGLVSADVIILNSVPCMICVVHDVTEQRAAQMALAESESTLRAILTASPIGIGLVKDRRMQWANKSMERITGYKCHEFITRGNKFLYKTQDEYQRVGRVLYDPASDINETDAEQVNAWGQTISVHLVSQRVDPQDPERGYIIAATDITERKRAEVALANSEETLRTIFSALPIGIALLEKGRVDWVNQAALDMIGYQLDDVLGKSVDFIYSDPKEGRQAKYLVKGLMAKNETGSFETQWTRKDGGLVDCLVRVTPLRREGHAPQVLVTASDISERKKAERALRESETKLRAAFEAAQDVAFIITDPDGVEFLIREFSPGARRIFGYQENEVIGRPISLLNIKEVPAVAGKLMPGLQDAAGGLTHEMTLMRKNREAFPALVGVYPLMQPNGAMIGALVMVMDQSERKRAEKRAADQQRQLAQSAKMASLGTLASGIAHEINNPILSVILNAPALHNIWRDLEPLLDEYQRAHGEFEAGGFYFHELVDEVPTLIGNIHDGARRVKNIVADLKSYSRETPLVTNEAVRINDAVQAAITLTNNLIKKSTDRFSVQLAEGLPVFQGNVQRVEQVLINLLVNACEALPSPDRSIGVRTFYDPEQDAVMVSVKDQGVGISPDVLPRVTDPFFTTKRGSGGTGLGLSVSAGIMENHGGQLVIEPGEPYGVSVTLSFPAGTN